MRMRYASDSVSPMLYSTLHEMEMSRAERVTTTLATWRVGHIQTHTTKWITFAAGGLIRAYMHTVSRSYNQDTQSEVFYSQASLCRQVLPEW